MGMDVMGISPASEAGEYFRANCWSWRVIHLAMHWCDGNAILGEEAMEHMAFNDGAGATSSDQCEKMATALEQWGEELDGDIISPSELDDEDFQITESGGLAAED